MWKLPAGPGANVVNHALPVFHQKRAGRGIHDRIAVFVLHKVLFFEGCGLHTEGFRDAGHICFRDDGRDATAATGTIEAIYF